MFTSWRIYSDPVPTPGQSRCWGEGIRTVLSQAADLWPAHPGERSFSPKGPGWVITAPHPAGSFMENTATCESLTGTQKGAGFRFLKVGRSPWRLLVMYDCSDEACMLSWLWALWGALLWEESIAYRGLAIRGAGNDQKLVAPGTEPGLCPSQGLGLTQRGVGSSLWEI